MFFRHKKTRRKFKENTRVQLLHLLLPHLIRIRSLLKSYVYAVNHFVRAREPHVLVRSLKRHVYVCVLLLKYARKDTYRIAGNQQRSIIS